MPANGRRDLIRRLKVNCVKQNCTKNWTEYALAQHRFPTKFVSFFVSSVCLLLHVTMADKNKAVVCCLLATSTIMLPEKRKESVKCGVVVFEIECIMRCSSVEWIARKEWWRWLLRDDVIGVSAGKLRKLWYSLSELRSSLCERRLERTVLRSALLPAVYAVFLSGMTSQSKISQFNRECVAHLRRFPATNVGHRGTEWCSWRKICKTQSSDCWKIRLERLKKFEKIMGIKEYISFVIQKHSMASKYEVL